MVIDARRILASAQTAARSEPIQNHFLKQEGARPLAQGSVFECIITGYLNGIIGVAGERSIPRYYLDPHSTRELICATDRHKSEGAAVDLKFVDSFFKSAAFTVNQRLALAGQQDASALSLDLFHFDTFAVVVLGARVKAFTLLPCSSPTEEEFVLKVDSLGGDVTRLSLDAYMGLIGGLDPFADSLAVSRYDLVGRQHRGL